MTHEQLSLENFVYWLIHASEERKYKYRDKICSAVQLFGKKIVLEELERQGKNTMNLSEAIIMARTIKDM